MKLTILGSGGCMVIPKPLCRCRICREARVKGIPHARGGPSAVLHDANLLIDTPAEICSLLNRENIRNIDYLMLTHLDPDHVEGLRVVEQIALDFRTWQAYPQKKITLLIPEQLENPLKNITTQYGPAIDHYVQSGFLEVVTFCKTAAIGEVNVTGIPVDRGSQTAFIYIFGSSGHRIVYAPCDIKPSPEGQPEVHAADLLVIQPGVFETGLRHGFTYPSNHVSRQTLYTFEQTLAKRIGARQIVFTHLEEYWHRSYDDYLQLEQVIPDTRFAYGGMTLCLKH
jgi:phosphoribosyl 1,2-cyclic phosphate phosphodiesterase